MLDYIGRKEGSRHLVRLADNQSAMDSEGSGSSRGRRPSASATAPAAEEVAKELEARPRRRSGSGELDAKGRSSKEGNGKQGASGNGKEGTGSSEDEGGRKVERDLNEFVHAVQRFGSVGEYESTRLAYCSTIVSEQCHVEDAITGNVLRIEDQLIFVSAADVSGTNIGPKWASVRDVRDVVTLLLEPSTQRHKGTHAAQPLLCRAGPGTGKTWMVKQALYTVASRLVGAEDGSRRAHEGVKLVPVVLYVQRIVRLLREAGEDMSVLTSRRLLLFYIENEFSGKRHATYRQMLLQAYELRALVVLLDGIDEAAGMRNEIEMFVHQELAPSNNRIIVTSRPEGVQLALYLERFVVMNLLELTDEQQRNVIKVQMHGSEFFDHLLAVSEIRKGLDSAYAKAFPSATMRRRIETLPAIDTLTLADGSLDLSRRLCEAGGTRLIKERPSGHPTILSTYLRTLDKQLQQTVRIKPEVAAQKEVAQKAAAPAATRPRRPSQTISSADAQAAPPASSSPKPPVHTFLEKLDFALKHLGPGYSEEQVEEVLFDLEEKLERADLDEEARARAHAEADAEVAEAHARARAEAARTEAAMSEEERAALAEKRAALAESALAQKAFDEFDTDGSGAIDMEELRTLLFNCGKSASDERLQSLIARFDANGDGVLQFDEFRNMIAQWDEILEEEANLAAGEERRALAAAAEKRLSSTVATPPGILVRRKSRMSFDDMDEPRSPVLRKSTSVAFRPRRVSIGGVQDVHTITPPESPEVVARTPVVGFAEVVEMRAPPPPPPPQADEELFDEFLDADARAVATALALYAQKQRAIPGAKPGAHTTHKLWRKILRRTDELYVVAEQLRPVMKGLLRGSVSMLDGIDADDGITDIELKDPVTVFETANSEYDGKTNDGVLAEACLRDVLRGRVIATSGASCLALLGRLTHGITAKAVMLANGEAEVIVDAGSLPTKKAVDDAAADPDGAPPVAAEGSFTQRPGSFTRRMSRRLMRAASSDNLIADKVVRVGEPEPASLAMAVFANKFIELDPTHIRFGLCTLQLSWGPRSMLVELEVHHADVLEYYEDMGAFFHYYFFRSRLEDASVAGETAMSPSQIDDMLERVLLFLVEASGVPVLLSMLVLIFASGGEDLTKLPANRLQLYTMATECAVRRRLTSRAKEKVVAAEAMDEQEEEGEGEEEDVAFLQEAAAESQKSTREKREERKAAKEKAQGGKKKDDKDGGDGEAGTSTTPRTKGEAAKFVRKGAKGPTRGSAEAAPWRAGAKSSVELEVSSGGGGTDGSKGLKASMSTAEMYDSYALAARILDAVQKGASMRSKMHALVPKGHKLRAMVAQFVEGASSRKSYQQTVGMDMLRRVAVSNQLAGRREFSSKHVVTTLDGHSKEMMLWLSLNKDEAGVILTKTLEVQTDNAPAQYQFKHLSFQEGLYAQHLLQTILALREHKGSSGVWEGWATNAAAADFLNNAYMNNVCRIASGKLGRLLATQRAEWNFADERCRLSWVGRSALWLIMDENTQLKVLNLSNNIVTAEDAPGVARMLSTCTGLQTLNLGATGLGKLDRPPLFVVAKALSTNTTLTELHMAGSALGPEGTATVVGALKSCAGLKMLDLSDNQPTREQAVAELMKTHTTLETLVVVESEAKHLDSRVRDAIGRALLGNPGSHLQYIECDGFRLGPITTSLRWKAVTASDAIMLAGALKVNTVLTSFELGSGELNDDARETIGKALLLNEQSRMGFCDDYGLLPDVTAHEYDLKANIAVKKLPSFTMLCGVLSGNTRLESLSIKALDSDHIEPLAEALRGNSTLQTLTLVHQHKTHASEVALPVQQLNGRTILTRVAISGELGRISTAVVGHLISQNTNLCELSLSGTQLGSDGGNVFEYLSAVFSNPECSLTALDLSNILLGDRGGTKLFGALLAGARSTITTLKLGGNGLREETGRAMIDVLRAETCLLRSLDLSANQISGGLIARAVKFAHSLTQLDVRETPIDDEGFRTLGELLLADDSPCKLGYIRCDAFELRPDQTDISLGEPRPHMQPGAFSLLAGVVRYNTTLTSLGLANAGIDAEGAEHLATAIGSNESLQEVDLSGNQLLRVAGASEDDHTGVHALTTALQMNETLTSVTLDDGATLPVRRLKGAERVSALDLSQSKIGFLSAMGIGGLIKSNLALTDLNLMGNEMGALGCAAVARVGRFSALRGLNLSLNQMGGTEDGETSSAEAIEQVYLAVGRMGALERLALDHNALQQGELLGPIGQMANLQKLVLTQNRLACLPPALGQLRSLTDLAVANNQLMELPATIGRLAALEKLSAQNNLLTYLPEAIGQLGELRYVLLSDNRLQRLPQTLAALSGLEKLEVAHNPLQRPPISVVRQGLVAMRRYFADQSRGTVSSRSGRLVLIGPSGSGKTMLQRGLRVGAPAVGATDTPPRTVYCDLQSLCLGGEGSETNAEPAVLVVCDISGDAPSTGSLVPYLAPGALYLLCVAAHKMPVPRATSCVASVANIPTDDAYSGKICDWLTKLQLGAPTAAVQPVITHCDMLLPPMTVPAASSLSSAASQHVTWLLTLIDKHQEALPESAPRIRLQTHAGKDTQGTGAGTSYVPCVCSVHGGSATLDALYSRIEQLVLGQKPSIVPSVGPSVPRGVTLASAMLRALRDGKDPTAYARYVSSGNDPPVAAPELTVPMVTMAEARRRWLIDVAPNVALGDGVEPASVLEDAIKLLCAQGEMATLNGAIHLDPDLVNRMTAPLVDARLSRAWATPRALEHTAETAPDQPRTALLLAAVDALVEFGELREELLPLLWTPAGFKADDYASILTTLAASGGIFLPVHSPHGRKWLMPTRLPQVFAPGAVMEWASAELTKTERIVLSYRLGAPIPPGTAERLVGIAGAFGQHEHYWRRGVLVQTHACGGVPLLVEVRPEPVLTEPAKSEPPPAQRDPKDLMGPHEIAIEVHGAVEERAELWALLLQVKSRIDVLLADTVGLSTTTRCELCCPGCSRIPGPPQPMADGKPTSPGKAVSPGASTNPATAWPVAIPLHKRSRWAVDRVMSTEALTCAACKESISLMSVTPLNAHVPIGLEPSTEMRADMLRSAMRADRRFVGEHMRLGLPAESGGAIHRMLAISKKHVKALLTDGDAAMSAEVAARVAAGAELGSAPLDGLGWNVADWLKYLTSAKAGEHGLDAAHLSGILPDVGHEGRSLDAFVAHPMSQVAGLDRVQVLALRLLSSGALAEASVQLRCGCTAATPHAFPLIVLQLVEALKKLRTAVVAPRADRLAKAERAARAEAARAEVARAAAAISDADNKEEAEAEAEAEVVEGEAAPEEAASRDDPPLADGTGDDASVTADGGSHGRRAVKAEAFKPTAPPPALWRVVRLHSLSEFVQRGGVELGFSSLTPDQATAEAQAFAAMAEEMARPDAAPNPRMGSVARAASTGKTPRDRTPRSTATPRGRTPTTGCWALLKVLPADEPLRCAPSDVTFLSAYANEAEYVLPPGTYFSTSGRGGKCYEDRAKRLWVIDVVPCAAASWF